MGLELLAQRRIQKSVSALQDIRLRPANLLWYNRIPLVDADDDEILARSTEQVVLADIVADDARAVVRREKPITLHDIHIPNIKHGSHFSQKYIKLLRRLQSQAGTLPEDISSFNTAISRKILFLEAGVKAQCEMMLIGMLIDDFDYDNMGVKLSNITWGMPADLKVTVSNVWSNPTTGTPIADILAVVSNAATKYGVTYTRMTLRRSTFNYIIATDEFQDLAKLYSQMVFPTTFPTNDVNLMKTLLVQMLGGMTIEFYDYQTFYENSYGVRTAVPYLPAAKVILSDPQFDNDSSIWDLANGEVTESVVASVAGLDTQSAVIGGFSGPQRGPVGYVTAPSDLNPPNLTMWDVMRAFPRKTEQAANACLTVL